MIELGLIINLVVFGLFTIVLIIQSITEAKQEKKKREKYKKAA